MADVPDRIEFNDLPQAVRFVAERKRAAAASRSQPTNPLLPAPRDVFVAAARAVHQDLEPLGFKFLKGGPAAVRQRNGRREEVWFSSSHNNVRGEYIDFEVGVGVLDRAHQRWQVENGSPFDPSGGCGGGNIGNVDNAGYVTWNVASDASRPAVLAEVTGRVRTVALPFFDLFDDPPALVDRLVNYRRPPATSAWWLNWSSATPAVPQRRRTSDAG